jgi:TM2 domain-containing membrane protein YozV
MEETQPVAANQIEPAQEGAGQKSFLVAWLLSLLLGFFGADRFYLGKIWTGVLKLVTLGGLGIWWLVDLILILGGAGRDANNQPLDGAKQYEAVAWIVSAVVVVGLGALTFGGSDDSANNSASTENAAVSEEKEPATAPESPVVADEEEQEVIETTDGFGIGQKAVTKDGIEVTLVAVNYDVQSPNRYVTEETKGELASIEMIVFNGSSEPLSLGSSSVDGLIDDLRYKAAAVFSDKGDWYVYENLNPRLEVTIVAYLDVPPGDKLTGAVFSTSIFFGESLEFTF